MLQEWSEGVVLYLHADWNHSLHSFLLYLHFLCLRMQSRKHMAIDLHFFSLCPDFRGECTFQMVLSFPVPMCMCLNTNCFQQHQDRALPKARRLGLKRTQQI